MRSGLPWIYAQLPSYRHACRYESRGDLHGVRVSDLGSAELKLCAGDTVPVEPCPFCQVSGVTIAERPQAFSVYDNYPVTDLHSLILPRRHVASFFELTLRECEECIELLHETRDMVRKADGRITGFNVGINDGRDAGQTISHCHIHLIPRRKNDVERPMGGIRHVIPQKGHYGRHARGGQHLPPGPEQGPARQTRYQ